MAKKKRNTEAKTTKRAGKRRKKTTYQAGNWAAYNASLVQRGSISLWISDEVIAGWKPEPGGVRQRGGQVQYSDQAIACLLTLRAVFKLPYRQTEGFGRWYSVAKRGKNRDGYQSEKNAAKNYQGG